MALSAAECLSIAEINSREAWLGSAEISFKRIIAAPRAVGLYLVCVAIGDEETALLDPEERGKTEGKAARLPAHQGESPVASRRARFSFRSSAASA